MLYKDPSLLAEIDELLFHNFERQEFAETVWRFLPGATMADAKRVV